MTLTEEDNCPQPLARDTLQGSQLSAWVTLGVSMGTGAREHGPGLPAAAEGAMLSWGKERACTHARAVFPVNFRRAQAW